jgi:Anti-sigma-K factor rskA
MVAGQGTPNDDVRSGPETHEEFLELCALSSAGTLTEEEQKKLREHLTVCLGCCEAMKQFEIVVDHTIPALAPELANSSREEADRSFSVDAAEKLFLKRLSEEDKKSRSHLADPEPWLSPLVIRQSRNFRRRFERYYFWLPMTAGIVLCSAFGIVTYRSGIYRGVAVGQHARPIFTTASFPPALEVASRELDAANAQLAERNKAISDLEGEIARQQRAENARLKALQSDQELALRALGEEKKKLAAERDQAVQQAAANAAALQAKLENLERQRSEEASRVASLDAQVAELSRSLQVQEQSKVEEDELLSKDRDIRELMGARDLYVAEVHDVAGTGEMKKAFGRVFYTKGKSLIFYAFDLKEQRRIEDASFQVWGRRGPDWSQALKLGMFYEDNVSKKRWVLKFNDKKTLDQIDAVFVTVEPHGGSERPTGKPLLFAYLKVTPNHP